MILLEHLKDDTALEHQYVQRRWDQLEFKSMFMFHTNYVLKLLRRLFSSSFRLHEKKYYDASTYCGSFCLTRNKHLHDNGVKTSSPSLQFYTKQPVICLFPSHR
ncbi:hypothetical protein TNCV_1968641 [Trichonephila clavipes]|nr:hypothetical protein TNCV_1968641 [Trichonephila clavipes]